MANLYVAAVTLLIAISSTIAHCPIEANCTVCVVVGCVFFEFTFEHSGRMAPPLCLRAHFEPNIDNHHVTNWIKDPLKCPKYEPYWMHPGSLDNSTADETDYNNMYRIETPTGIPNTIIIILSVAAGFGFLSLVFVIGVIIYVKKYRKPTQNPEIFEFTDMT